MATTGQKPKTPFRFTRLIERMMAKEVLTPFFEESLLKAGENTWPDAYSIRVTNKERVWDGYFHPSMHIQPPELLLYYEFHPEHRLLPQVPSVDLIMAFQVGKALHALVQSMLIHLGFTTEEEVEQSFIDEARRCSGTLDVRRVILPDGRTMPVEIKSTGRWPREVDELHEKQLQVYMDVGCGVPQDQGIVFYIEKSYPHRVRDFLIERNEGLLAKIYEKWDRVREAIQFSDAALLKDCCQYNSSVHFQCPARETCRIGPPSMRSFA